MTCKICDLHPSEENEVSVISEIWSDYKQCILGVFNKQDERQVIEQWNSGAVCLICIHFVQQVNTFSAPV